jgi:hypothetical protein
MKNLTLIFAILFQNVAITQSIYTYNNATDGSYATINDNISATNLTRVNGASTSSFSCTNGFTSDDFTKTSFNTNNEAIEFTLTPNLNYRMNINSLTIDLRRSGTGPANVRLAYKIGSGSFIDKGSDDSPNNGNCDQLTNHEFPSLAITTNSSVTFRIYPFNATHANGTLQIRNIQIGGSSALPVELLNFKAEKQDNRVNLTWQTASETNNDRFEIERSNDGKLYQVVGVVKGFGTTHVAQNYSFTDYATPSVTVCYYRLKQIDFDGSFDYSLIKSIVLEENAFRLVHNAAASMLLVQMAHNTITPYSIYNGAGFLLESGKIQNDSPIFTHSLPTGLYFIKVGKKTERFVKL